MDVQYNSTFMQFIASELYAKDIELVKFDRMADAMFGKKEKNKFIMESHILNDLRIGDQAVFVYKKAR